jgi:hypothetical protein
VKPNLTEGWHLDASAADVNRRALATHNGGASSVQSTDLAGSGGRTLHVSSNGWVELPLVEGDPGSHWTMHFWFRVDGGGFNRVSHALRSSSGDLGVHLVSEVPSAAPSARRLSIRHGPSNDQLFTFPNGSSATAASYKIEVVEHATEGIVRAWRNDELAWEGTELNTSRGGTWDRLRLGPGSEVSVGRHGHVVVAPGAPLGDEVLVGLFAPGSDVGPNEWERTDEGLAHYQHLQDAPHDGDTTRLDTGTVGEKTRHGVAVPDLAGRQVIALRPAAVYRSGGRLGVSVISGEASPVDSILGVAGDEFLERRGSWLDEDPATGLGWRASGIEAAAVELELLAEES